MIVSVEADYFPCLGDASPLLAASPKIKQFFEPYLVNGRRACIYFFFFFQPFLFRRLWASYDYFYSDSELTAQVPRPSTGGVMAAKSLKHTHTACLNVII